jgi:hypothetical protein
MSKKIGLSLSAGLLMMLLVAAPALAYLYRAKYTITESLGTDYDMVAVVTANVSNQFMADNGFMAVTANDTRVETLGGAVRPHMVSANRTLTAIAIPAHSQTNLYFTTGNSALAVMDVIVGNNGYITIADHSDIELGNSFEIDMKGYYLMSTSNPSTDNFIIKTSSFRLWNSSNGEMAANIIGGPTCTVSGLAGGVYRVVTDYDAVTFRLFVYDNDDVLLGSDSVAWSGTVTDNANDWTIMQRLVYMDYLKVEN